MDKVRLVTIMAAFTLLAAVITPPAAARPIRAPLSLTFATGQPDLFRPAVTRYMHAHPNVTIHILPIEGSTTDQLTQYRQALSVQSPLIDIYDIEVSWPSLFADHLTDLRTQDSAITTQAIESHFPAAIQAYTVDGRLTALPYHIDTGVLYYRPGLLDTYGYEAPPATWDELTEMAQTIQEGERTDGAHLDFWGYLWQGERYEGLTCNALEWHGGRLFDAAGQPNVDTPAIRAALERAAGWVGTISPPAVVAFTDEDGRSQWLNGLAAFMRSWAQTARTIPTQSQLAAFDIAPLPEGGCLRGWGLAVSRYSQHQDAAAEVVAYLTGTVEQRQRTLESTANPTVMSLYSDAELVDISPVFPKLQTVFMHAFARPAQAAGSAYDNLSRAYYTAVNRVISGERDAADALVELEAEMLALMPPPTATPTASPTPTRTPTPED